MNRFISNSKVITKFVLIILSVAFIIIGVIDEGFAECVHKSIGICWECIGLG